MSSDAPSTAALACSLPRWPSPLKHSCRRSSAVGRFKKQHNKIKTFQWNAAMIHFCTDETH